MDEYSNNQYQEQASYSDYSSSAENISFNENVTAAEYAAYDETNNNERTNGSSTFNQRKKKNALSSLSTGVVSTIAAATVGITSMINVSMNAEFKNVEYKDGYINYTASVSNMTEDEKLTAYLYDGDEILCSVSLTDDDNDGIIDGSIPVDSDRINSKLKDSNDKISYRVSLKGVVGLDVERDFDSYVVEMEKMTSAFEKVTGECKCAEDGCYHFLIHFKDDLGLFDSFEAQIEDKYGNISKCTFTDDLHDEQTIFVSNLKGTAGTMTVKYKADGQPQTVKIDITM